MRMGWLSVTRLSEWRLRRGGAHLVLKHVGSEVQATDGVVHGCVKLLREAAMREALQVDHQTLR